MKKEANVIKVFAIIVALVALGVFTVSLTGCANQSEIVSHNVSKQADNFNVVRRLTVINTRTDKCILQMTGKMSLEDHEDGIVVIVEVDRKRGIYQKHMVYTNKWTVVTVEDVSGTGVSKYAYEIQFMPQELAPVRIRTDEIEQDFKDIAGIYETEADKEDHEE